MSFGMEADGILAGGGTFAASMDPLYPPRLSSLVDRSPLLSLTGFPFAALRADDLDPGDLPGRYVQRIAESCA